jgi:hypothetical protein
MITKGPADIVVVGKPNGALPCQAIRTKLLRTGYIPAPMTVEQYATFVDDDVAEMIKLGKDAYIRPLD